DMAHPDACGSGSFCLMPTCTGTGTCIKFQADPKSYVPVCGCDHLNYWNGSVASDQKAAIRAADRCQVGLPCTPGSDCTTGSVQGHCDLSVPTQSECLATPPTGTCWVLPSDCQNTPGTGFGCDASHPCKTQCDFILNNEAWTPATCAPM